jgi:hypothetical protein
MLSEGTARALEGKVMSETTWVVNDATRLAVGSAPGERPHILEALKVIEDEGARLEPRERQW